ncbi:hypothetical protein K488DRAFT_12409, partial [Vararia minispora EC-137]
YFITGRPLVYPRVACGRSTFGYIAHEEERKYVVWLKDTLRRSGHDLDIDTEGEIYRILHKVDVCHIPKLVYAGDVYSATNATESSSPRTTVTREYLEGSWVCSSAGVGHHAHYRHVVLGLGRPLTTFKCPKEVVAAALHSLSAHEDAFTRAKILHRDISVGNILITLDGQNGLLIDWELTLSLDRKARTTRKWTTGTWQFMSIRLLQRFTHSHDASDDMESFFWVIIFVFMRY